MPVDISATFTKKERVRNGLEAIAKDLTEDPLTRRVVIGVVECIRTVTDHVSGDAQTPVVKFVHIEPMLSDKEEADARKLFERAFKKRTGNSPEDPLPAMDGEQLLPTGEDDEDEPE